MKKLSVLALAAIVGGCGYVGDRINDARDIVHADVSLGPQLGVTARFTHIFQAGVASEGAILGKDHEDWYYDTAHIAWNGRWGGIYKRIGHEAGVGPEAIEPKWYQRHYDAEYYEEYKEQERTPDEIGVSVGAVLAGAEVGVRPAEAFDFILGFFGQDILKDDGEEGDCEDLEEWMAEEEYGCAACHKHGKGGFPSFPGLAR